MTIHTTNNSLVAQFLADDFGSVEIPAIVADEAEGTVGSSRLDIPHPWLRRITHQTYHVLLVGACTHTLNDHHQVENHLTDVVNCIGSHSYYVYEKRKKERKKERKKYQIILRTKGE